MSKKVVLLLVCLTGIATLSGQQAEGIAEYDREGPPQPSGLFPIQQDGKWGYIDKEGKLVIPSQFDRADLFLEGLALINVGFKPGYLQGRIGGDNGKWGYIEPTGKIVIKPQFDNARSFSEGLALVWIGRKAGFIDKAGKLCRMNFKRTGEFFCCHSRKIEGWETRKIIG